MPEVRISEGGEATDATARRVDTTLHLGPGGSSDFYYQTIFGDLETTPVFVGNLDGCYRQGQAAGIEGLWRTKNPYSVGTAEREWWDSGWCWAEDKRCRRE